MKSVYKYIVCLLGAAIAFAGITSCNKADYPNRFRLTDGLPTIHYVRQADADVFITQGYMDDVVCLVGDNLTSIREIYFNDQKAIINTALLTDHTLIITIPGTQAEVVTNKIYMYNLNGDSSEYEFKVLPPLPKVSGINCEWPKPGNTVKIFGRYFIDVLEINISGTAIEEFTVEDSETISFIAPEGIAPGPVIITTESGSGTSSFWYLDQRNMLFDFDTPNPLTKVVLDKNGWNSHFSTTDDTALSGNFFLLGNGTSTVGGWNEEFGFVYWPGDSWEPVETFAIHPRLYDIADFSDWQNKGLKFEMNIPAENAWSTGTMQIIFAGTNLVTGAGAGVDIDNNPVPGANNTYFTSEDYPRAHYKPWESVGAYHTNGEWVTVFIPFTDFVYTYKGIHCENSMDEKSFASLWMFVVGGDDSGASTVIKLDNIRVSYK